MTIGWTCTFHDKWMHSFIDAIQEQQIWKGYYDWQQQIPNLNNNKYSLGYFSVDRPTRNANSQNISRWTVNAIVKVIEQRKIKSEVRSSQNTKVNKDKQRDFLTLLKTIKEICTNEATCLFCCGRLLSNCMHGQRKRNNSTTALSSKLTCSSP